MENYKPVAGSPINALDPCAPRVDRRDLQSLRSEIHLIHERLNKSDSAQKVLREQLASLENIVAAYLLEQGK